jgi:hypothetical protein
MLVILTRLSKKVSSTTILREELSKERKEQLRKLLDGGNRRDRL